MISDARYQRDLALGLAYEEWVYDVALATTGVDLGPCVGLVEQLTIGENRAGVEIKLDRKFRETGRYFIETEERPTAKDRWRPSGIYRKDNCKWFLIGDRDGFVVIPVGALRVEAQTPDGPAWSALPRGHRRVAIPTAKGFLLERGPARRIAVAEYDRGKWRRLKGSPFKAQGNLFGGDVFK